MLVPRLNVVSMLDSVELVELDSHDDDNETCSLLSGLTDHTKEEQVHLTSTSSPFDKTLRSMKTLAGERRRQSLGKVLTFSLCLVIGFIGFLSMYYFRLHRSINPSPVGPSRLVVNASNAIFDTFEPNESQTTIYKAPIHIIVQMSGEMGNHLSKLASGIGVSLYLRDTYHIESSELMLRHQERTDKWKPAVAYLKQCFPFAKELNFSEAQSYYAPTNSPFDGINDTNETVIMAAIGTIAQATERVNQSSPVIVYSNHLALLDAYMDRYYEVYREYFAMNQTCCATLPDDDEVVLHMRLFTKEMPRKGVQKGYEELSPKDLIEQALKPYATNTTKKIAILSRYPDHLDEYVQALSDAGWNVRVLANQTATQDFCFLMNANTMIGSVRSTFFFWAAVLSNTAQRVLAYSVDSPAKRAWANDHNTTVLESYPFQNPAIREKFQFPLYLAT